MAEFEVNQLLFVRDAVDNTLKECKIVEKDELAKKVIVHFLNWNKRYDEWLPFDSPRINPTDILDSDSKIISPVEESPREVQCKVVIGKLLNLSDTSGKLVFSAYDISKDSDTNEKSLTKFNVSALKQCADTLKLSNEDTSGKKLLKAALVRSIVKKIHALMPSECSECKNEYSDELGETSPFTCHLCSRGSHSCVEIKNFKASLPDTLIVGLVWMCGECCIMPNSSDQSLEACQTSSGAYSEDTAIHREVTVTDVR